jgi:branched-chain amino acid transport system ATP-binding protein
LATHPKFLLLDEVISGLNQEETVEASLILKRIRDEIGITIIWVEHIMQVLMNLVEKVFVLNFGELIAQGTPLEVSRDERVIQAYLGAE